MIPYWGPLSEQTQPMPHPTPRRADFTVPRPRPPTLALYFIGRVIDVWSLCQSFITERSSFKGGSMFWMMDEQGSLSGKLHCNCSCIWHAGYERRFEWTFMAKGCSRITHVLVCTCSTLPQHELFPLNIKLTKWEEKRWRDCVYPQSQQPASQQENQQTDYFPSRYI